MNNIEIIERIRDLEKQGDLVIQEKNNLTNQLQKHLFYSVNDLSKYFHDIDFVLDGVMFVLGNKHFRMEFISNIYLISIVQFDGSNRTFYGDTEVEIFEHFFSHLKNELPNIYKEYKNYFRKIKIKKLI